MEIVEIFLSIAIILCGLVTGFVLAFAIVVMPGIGTLSDARFLESFKVMDRVIQNNHPVFMFVWVGSILMVVVAAIITLMYAEGWRLLLSLTGAGLYIVGVQIPTMVFNIPLNNRLQNLDIEKASETEISDFRTEFEPNWNKWNVLRTINGLIATSILLLSALLF